MITLRDVKGSGSGLVFCLAFKAGGVSFGDARWVRFPCAPAILS